MKIKALGLFLISMLLPLCCLAEEASGFFMTFTNLLSTSGEVAMLQLRGPATKGPLVEKNGGKAQWLFTPSSKADTKLSLVGIHYSKTAAHICFSNGKNIKLDLSKYRNDVINITFTSYNQGRLECTCSGSAC